MSVATPARDEAALAHCEQALKAGDRDRWLGALWAPPRARARLVTLFALELELWSIPVRVRDPLAAEMRLAWWREALVALDAGPPPAQPLLEAAALHLCPSPGGAALAALEDAPLLRLRGEPAIAVAGRRGPALFTLAAGVLGAASPDGTGHAWAAGEATRDGDIATASALLNVAPPLRPLLALDRLGVRDQRRPGGPEPRGSLARQALLARTVLLG